MLDLRLIREDPNRVAAAIATLNTTAPIDEIVALDERHRAILTQVEALKAERNEGSKIVSRTKDPAERETLIANLRGLGDDIAQLDEESKELDARLQDLLLQVPNLPMPGVPVGPDESANVVVAEHGRKRDFPFPRGRIGSSPRRSASSTSSAASRCPAPASTSSGATVPASSAR